MGEERRCDCPEASKGTHKFSCLAQQLAVPVEDKVLGLLGDVLAPETPAEKAEENEARRRFEAALAKVPGAPPVPGDELTPELEADLRRLIVDGPEDKPLLIMADVVRALIAGLDRARAEGDSAARLLLALTVDPRPLSPRDMEHARRIARDLPAAAEAAAIGRVIAHPAGYVVEVDGGLGVARMEDGRFAVWAWNMEHVYFDDPVLAAERFIRERLERKMGWDFPEEK